MPKINHEEYEKIKLLPDYDWNWIAREKAGKILSFTNKPTKTDEVWKDKQTRLWFNYKDSQLFQFIQWEDEDPYNIAELIEEYEDSKEYKDSLVIEYFLDKAKEGEETEVRKEEIINGLRTLRGELANNYKDNQRIGFIAGVNRAIEFIHSTDEPETISQEWIVDNVSFIQAGRGYVLGSRLQNLLVPKQEEVEEGRVRLTVGFDGGTESYYATDIGDALGFLTDYDARFTVSKEPAIPQFVAEWISERNEIFDLYPALKRLENSALSWEDVYEWYRKNTHTFVNAYLTGKYTVEEEQRYYIYLGDGQYLVSEDELREQYAKIRHQEDSGFSNYVLTFTEQEIKDYDPRYWPFAEKVEELEE